MSLKIFYHPDTLKIKGMSDGEDSMNFPYVETEEFYHSTQNLGIEKDKKGLAKLKVLEGALAIPESMLFEPVVEPIKEEVIVEEAKIEEPVIEEPIIEEEPE